MADGVRIDAAIPSSYQAAGLCVLPARLPAKRPAIGAWKDYQARLPTAAEVAAWFANLHHACCLICGAVSGNLELIDFDCAGEAFQAWSQLVAAEAPGLLDRLAVETSPSGGWHVVYRSAEPVCGSVKVASRREDVDGPAEVVRFGKSYKPRKDRDGRWHLILTMIETRGEGGLFLCAPSPGYQLMQGAFTALPVLTAAERDVLLRCAWALNAVLPETQDPQPASREGLRPGDDFNRQADVAALLTHHGWSLFRDGENQHWCRPGKTNATSATLKGGVFYVFSSNAAPFESNRAYSPFAVYAHLEHAGDFQAAALALRQAGFGEPLPPAHPVVPIEEPAAPTLSDPGPVPNDLLRVPGFVAEVMDFTMATAPYPEPVLAFCGALALQATLAGRKVRDQGDGRPNLYLLGLANSGAGKDHPRKVNLRVLLEAGLAGCAGDNFASAEGLEDRMVLSPSMLFQTDEIDGLMTAIAKSQDGKAERIMEMLLKFFSHSNNLYHCRVKAGKDPLLIDQPNLVLYGTAIPKHFYESLSEKMLTNGMFARMLVFEAGRRGSGQEPSILPVPERIVATARSWVERQPGKAGNLGIFHPTPDVVPHEPTALALAQEIRQYADASYGAAEAADDTIAMAIWARANEKARKLALLYAVSANHARPVITIDAVRWSWAVVEHLTRRMLFMAGTHVYAGEFDARCKKLVAILQEWAARQGAAAWMPAWQVMRRMRISNHDLDAVRESLVGQRMVEFGEVRTGGPPRRLYRLASGQAETSSMSAATSPVRMGGGLAEAGVVTDGVNLSACNGQPIADLAGVGQKGVSNDIQ
jgi:hypothetical protein